MVADFFTGCDQIERLPMVRKRILISLVICFTVISLVQSKRVTYWSEMWKSPPVNSRFKADPRPAHPYFAAVISLSRSEPDEGYPMHSGIFSTPGLNDTFSVTAEFKNTTSSDISLVGESPTEWLVPEIYDLYADVRSELPLFDTSDVNFGFSHWEHDWYLRTDTTVTSIPTEGGLNVLPVMVYNLSGLPEGD